MHFYLIKLTMFNKNVLILTVELRKMAESLNNSKKISEICHVTCKIGKFFDNMGPYVYTCFHKLKLSFVIYFIWENFLNSYLKYLAILLAKEIDNHMIKKL